MEKYRFNKLNILLSGSIAIIVLFLVQVLSGTSEEILFRAIPITVLIYVFGKSINIKRSVTLETMIASFLFTIAHIKWCLLPFYVDANYFKLFYAFVLGTIQGIAYQESYSILYPILKHSMSNVLMAGMGDLFAVFAK